MLWQPHTTYIEDIQLATSAATIYPAPRRPIQKRKWNLSAIIFIVNQASQIHKYKSINMFISGSRTRLPPLAALAVFALIPPPQSPPEKQTHAKGALCRRLLFLLLLLGLDTSKRVELAKHATIFQVNALAICSACRIESRGVRSGFWPNLAHAIQTTEHPSIWALRSSFA